MPALFSLLLDTLTRLAQGADGDVVEIYFCLHAARLLGYDLQLDNCVACGRVLTEAGRFLPAEGGLLCSVCHPSEATLEASGETIAYAGVLRRCKLGQALQLAPRQSSRAELLAILRAHLRHHLDLPLRSLSILACLNEEVVGPSEQPGHC